MAEIKTERRALRYDFSAVEVHQLSVELANKTKDKNLLDEERASVASQYGSRIKVISSEINKLCNQVSDGWELRDVECQVEYHKPEKGKKTVTRLDNNKAVVETMDHYEWNLFNQPEEDDPFVEPEQPAKAKKERKPRKKKVKATLLLPAGEGEASGDEIEDAEFENEETEDIEN